MKTTLSQEFIVALLDYDPKTGIFTWKKRPSKMFKSESSWKTWNSRFAQKTAGCLGVLGYSYIGINGALYRAHRLAWVYMTGAWPKDRLDHKDGNPSNNRFENLRECTAAQNSFNSKLRENSRSGVNGVSYSPLKSKWNAQIRIGGGRQIQLGLFNSKEDAVNARHEAEIKHHGEFSSHLRPQRA